MEIIKGLAHVCFTVSDLDRSLAFYHDTLGMPLAFEFRNDKGERFGVYLSFGGRNFLELFQGGLQPPAEGQSFRHICLEVADINQSVAELKARGVEVTEVKFGSDNTWQSWLSDPDGNRIELHQYTEKSWQAPCL